MLAHTKSSKRGEALEEIRDVIASDELTDAA